MYINGSMRAGSTPVLLEVVSEEDLEGLLFALEARFGQQSHRPVLGEQVSIFDARGGFNWTVIAPKGQTATFFRQPSFAIHPRWTFVPNEEVPTDIRNQLFESI